MKEFLAITKALSDASRVRALTALAGGELCVCQIIELLGLAPSTVSKHMAVLHQAGLVDTRKDGRWVYYRLPARSRPMVRSTRRWVRQALADDTTAASDAARLRAIRKADKATLCVRYKQS